MYAYSFEVNRVMPLMNKNLASLGLLEFVSPFPPKVKVVEP